MAKVWTINVQVNTLYMSQLSGTGTWENPIGRGQYFNDNVRMTAVSNDPSDNVHVGNDNDFVLTVGADDQIRWQISEMNPIFGNHRSVVMYGFAKGDNWDNNLTPPGLDPVEVTSAVLLNGFDATSQPSGEFLRTDNVDSSVPHTTVRAKAKSATINYHMKVLLLDTSDIENPTISKYIQIDPKISIQK
ncbi:hypothetical protein [Pseudoalteromonas luteoviolacea]|uniref:Inclusion body protein n=2 Tax=Pseudoalteromonas luteoviolacea TaxID=43657 RepID=A0A0F6A8Y1_9GAMM|nr:hypothetical protein [Pseudoalteromonas luteoviolacea]AOT10915.1 hypothetical protein S4054249_24030 [Pseudoalteromonas luteoviolacea]AOT15922.1 hypothetical protein S40542_24480 [Pseudoalteromonas luteoviolacea]AOT20736.1 hypothetical protein S4054_23950 [Pseudoalteromonas luteoviolacea]KKE81839.1 hypothetical protein N479_02440 [Pseudoalteromonas luteoviolacea S4054]KZN66203.1 hypothetical protein N481_24640 [Pseudoalteromonas luteoviolacea S4047-1]